MINFKAPPKKVVMQKKKIKLEKLRFDPNLDMGNLYQAGYFPIQHNGPNLQGGPKLKP